MSHNEETRNFAITRTNDLATIGIYTVQILCTVQVMDDPILQEYSEVTQTFEFTVEIHDPCESTAFVEDYPIREMQRFVGQAEITQILPSINDTVSMQFGN